MEPATKKRKKGFELKVLCEEKVVFVDDTIELSLFLENEEGEIHHDHVDLPLTASLSFEDDDDESPPKGSLVVEEQCVISKGKGVLKCKIAVVSMDVNNRSFVIELAPSSKKKSDTLAQSVEVGATEAIEVVRQKLVMETEDWPKLFYKDQGGRDKCLHLPVSLVDATGSVVTGREVELKCTAQYESGVAVENQDVLEVHATSQNSIDPKTGRAEVKVRLNQVSRLHQNQDFQIKVGADPKNHDERDIASTMSPSVKVLSKPTIDKSKKKRKETATSISMKADDGMMEGLSPTGPESIGGTLEDSMRSVLDWIDMTLSTLQNTEAQMLELHMKSKQQAAEAQNVLQQYRRRIMSDLQLIVNTMAEKAGSDGSGAASASSSSSSSSAASSSLSSSLSSSSSSSSSASSSSSSSSSSSLTSAALSSASNMQSRPSALAAESLPGSGIGAVGGGPPLLSRQVSDAYFNDTGGVDNQGGNVLSYATSSFKGQNAGVDAQVSFVVAKIFCTKTSKMGFPAFSSDKQLLGFYQEVPDPEETICTVHEKMEFLPLDQARRDGSLSASNIRASSNSLEKELKRQSKSVMERQNFDSIENMKAKALLYHTEKTGSSNIGDVEFSSEFIEELSRWTSTSSGDMDILDPNWVFDA